MTYKFKEHEGAVLALEYRYYPRQPATHDEPPWGPEVEVTEAYIEYKFTTTDVTQFINIVERWTGLPIWEKLQEIILENQ